VVQAKGSCPAEQGSFIFGLRHLPNHRLWPTDVIRGWQVVPTLEILESGRHASHCSTAPAAEMFGTGLCDETHDQREETYADVFLRKGYFSVVSTV